MLKSTFIALFICKLYFKILKKKAVKLKNFPCFFVLLQGSAANLWKGIATPARNDWLITKVYTLLCSNGIITASILTTLVGMSFVVADQNS